VTARHERQFLPQGLEETVELFYHLAVDVLEGVAVVLVVTHVLAKLACTMISAVKAVYVNGYPPKGPSLPPEAILEKIAPIVIHNGDGVPVFTWTQF
jgi:hypothetical protein